MQCEIPNCPNHCLYADCKTPETHTTFEHLAELVG